MQFNMNAHGVTYSAIRDKINNEKLFATQKDLKNISFDKPIMQQFYEGGAFGPDIIVESTYNEEYIYTVDLPIGVNDYYLRNTVAKIIGKNLRKIFDITDEDVYENLVEINLNVGMMTHQITAFM